MCSQALHELQEVARLKFACLGYRCQHFANRLLHYRPHALENDAESRTEECVWQLLTPRRVLLLCRRQEPPTEVSPDRDPRKHLQVLVVMLSVLNHSMPRLRHRRDQLLDWL